MLETKAPARLPRAHVSVASKRVCLMVVVAITKLVVIVVAMLVMMVKIITILVMIVETILVMIVLVIMLVAAIVIKRACLRPILSERTPKMKLPANKPIMKNESMVGVQIYWLQY